MSLIPVTGLCFYNLIENQIKKNNTIKLTGNYLSSLHIVIILLFLIFAQIIYSDKDNEYDWLFF